MMVLRKGGIGTADPKLAVFIWDDMQKSGVRNLEKLLLDASNRVLRAKISAVVSNTGKGEVWALAQQKGIPFFEFSYPWTARRYQLMAEMLHVDYYVFTDWAKPIFGANRRTRFDPRRIVCVHPGLMPSFGSLRYGGMKIHQAVIAAHKRKEVTTSAVTVHFMSHKNGYGPVLFEALVNINPTDTPETLCVRLRYLMRKHQSSVVDLVVNDQICWNGKDPSSLTTPNWHLLRLYADVPTTKKLQEEEQT